MPRAGQFARDCFPDPKRMSAPSLSLLWCPLGRVAPVVGPLGNDLPALKPEPLLCNNNPILAIAKPPGRVRPDFNRLMAICWRHVQGQGRHDTGCSNIVIAAVPGALALLCAAASGSLNRVTALANAAGQPPIITFSPETTQAFISTAMLGPLGLSWQRNRSPSRCQIWVGAALPSSWRAGFRFWR